MLTDRKGLRQRERESAEVQYDREAEGQTSRKIERHIVSEVDRETSREAE